MNQLIIDDMPELYAKLKPYIEVLENLGFQAKDDFSFFTPKHKDNYEYFNGWNYKRNDATAPDGTRSDWVVDLASYTGEPKIEVYTHKIIKASNYCAKSAPDVYPYIIRNECYDGYYDSKIVDNIKDFKKEIAKYLKLIKTFQERVKKHDMAKDFT